MVENRFMKVNKSGYLYVGNIGFIITFSYCGIRIDDSFDNIKTYILCNGYWKKRIYDNSGDPVGWESSSNLD